MPSREAIFAYVKKKFGTEPEYPWHGIRTMRSCGSRAASGTA